MDDIIKKSEIQYYWALFQALNKNKIVEFYNVNGDWVEVDFISLTVPVERYRLSKKNKSIDIDDCSKNGSYIPFNKETILSYINLSIYNKATGLRLKITEFDDEGVTLGRNSEVKRSYRDLLLYYRFQDKSPVGVQQKFEKNEK